MSKLVSVVLLFLIGLCLLAGGYGSYMALMITGYSLMIAGILMIILAIVMAAKMKCETKTPLNNLFFKSPTMYHRCRKSEKSR